MRIISKHQDYYDSALAFGHDERVVFERNVSEYRMTIKKDSYPTEYDFMIPTLGTRGVHNRWSSNYDSNRKGFEFAYHPFTVAFCGKIYSGIEIKYRKGGYMGEWTSSFAYDFDSYVSLLKKYGLKFTDDSINRKWSWNTNRKGSPKCEKEVKEYFGRTGEDHISFFADKGKPIAICEQDEGFSNDCTLRFNSALSDVAFYKVFDAYTTFQELDMFISGVMTREGNPMAGISDTDLRDKHGFDKMSFKKAPTKRR